MAAQTHEADGLEFLIRDALHSDVDTTPDPGRMWAGLRARIESRRRFAYAMSATMRTPIPCAWLLGWRMMSLAHAVS